MRTHILLAVDGSNRPFGAIRLARTIAAFRGAEVEVIAVSEPASRPSPAAAASPDGARGQEDAAEALRRRVESQLAALGGIATSWPVSIETGPPGETIARVAGERQATLIVLGLHHYEPREHRAGKETPLSVTHLARIPVLAVPPTGGRLPRQVVIATDLRTVRPDGVRDILRIAARDAGVHLVHVLSGRGVDGKTSGSWGRHRPEMRRRLAELVFRLAPECEDRLRVHLPTGDPAREILRVAAAVGADLVAVGSHSYAPLGRILRAGVASEVVRGAACSVLVAPATEASRALALDLTEEELLANLGEAAEVALPTRGRA